MSADARLAGSSHNFLLMLTAETGIHLLFCSSWVSWVVVQGVNLLRNWLSECKGRRRLAQDKLIFFSYLVAFLALALFNTVDVSLFDLRLNLLDGCYCQH